jgi:hypothetical protein
MAFKYQDFRALATVGRKIAIADFGRIKLKGFMGWLTGPAHISLIRFRNRFSVARLDVEILTFSAARLITVRSATKPSAGAGGALHRKLLRISMRVLLGRKGNFPRNWRTLCALWRRRVCIEVACGEEAPDSRCGIGPEGAGRKLGRSTPRACISS